MNKEIIKNVIFSIKENELVMIFGLNGIRKTTIMKVLVGLFSAKSIEEVAINIPLLALSNAVYNGMGVDIRNLSITGEKVIKEKLKNEN